MFYIFSDKGKINKWQQNKKQILRNRIYSSKTKGYDVTNKNRWKKYSVFSLLSLKFDGEKKVDAKREKGL